MRYGMHSENPKKSAAFELGRRLIKSAGNLELNDLLQGETHRNILSGIGRLAQSSPIVGQGLLGAGLGAAGGGLLGAIEQKKDNENRLKLILKRLLQGAAAGGVLGGVHGHGRGSGFSSGLRSGRALGRFEDAQQEHGAPPLDLKARGSE